MKISITTLLMLFVSILWSQASYSCRTGHVNVQSSNRIMDIVADNYQVYSMLDASNGQVNFTGLMKSFSFKMGALDQAFNSSKVDLGPYTKFTFDGTLTNFKQVNFNKVGKYNVNVEGILKIGDQQRITSAKGTLEVKEDKTMRAHADFSIRIEESSMKTINDLMKKKLPSVVALDTQKLGISRDIKLSLEANYKPKL